ncbi:hypothetical protein ACP70R_022324 [Stipagrostis hirtigluma subsp. patula]
MELRSSRGQGRSTPAKPPHITWRGLQFQTSKPNHTKRRESTENQFQRKKQRMPSQTPVRVVSRRTVKPPPRPRERIPLTPWDAAMLSTNYIQKGLLFARPPLSTASLVDHLEAAFAGALAAYYPVAGRFVTEQHRDDRGDVVGCSVSVDCGGQGVEIVHAVADGVAIADVVPPDADV